MGAEKRREKRFKRRLRVVFDSDGSKVGGYTTNLSARGMQVTSAFIFPAGSVVRGKVELPDGKELPIEARVRWARKTQGTFSIMREKSMGLELLGTVSAEIMRQLDGAREETGRIPDAAIGTARLVTPAASPASPAAARPAAAPTPPPAAPAARRAPAPTPPPATPARVAPATSVASARPPAPAAPTAPAAARAAAPAVAAGPPGAPALRPGLEGTAHLAIDSAGPLTPTTAVALIEASVAAAIGPYLPPDLESRGMSLTLRIVDTEPLPVGSSLQALARVQSLSAAGRIVELAIELTEVGRPVASATHARVLVRRRG